ASASERMAAPPPVAAPERGFLPFAAPLIGEEEIQEVVDTLRSSWITTGPKAKRFEQEFAAYLGAPGALGLNSCTAGLHTALVTLGIGPGADVITTPMTFAASVNVLGREPRRLQLLRHEEPHDGRGRDAHRRRGVPRARADPEPARHEPRCLEPLRPGRGLVLRGRRAGLQVQHDGHPGGARAVAAAQ